MGKDTRQRRAPAVDAVRARTVAVRPPGLTRDRRPDRRAPPTSRPGPCDYPTGAWGREARDYHIAIRVPARAIGDEMLAGRVSLVVDGAGAPASRSSERSGPTTSALSTQINREVAHYTGQAELAAVIQEGLEARKAGDGDTATLKLGRAVQLAADGGNEATLRLLRNVVDVDDPVTGTVRLRHDVDVAEEMALDTRSTKTVRVSGRRP